MSRDLRKHGNEQWGYQGGGISVLGKGTDCAKPQDTSKDLLGGQRGRGWREKYTALGDEVRKVVGGPVLTLKTEGRASHLHELRNYVKGLSRRDMNLTWFLTESLWPPC